MTAINFSQYNFDNFILGGYGNITPSCNLFSIDNFMPLSENIFSFSNMSFNFNSGLNSYNTYNFMPKIDFEEFFSNLFSTKSNVQSSLPIFSQISSTSIFPSFSTTDVSGTPFKFSSGLTDSFQKTVSNCTITPKSTAKKTSGASKPQSSTHSSALERNVKHDYLNLTKSQAYKKAKTDPTLEELSKGKNWCIATESFITDIPFARKGTAKILDKVTEMIGEKLVITSALGTGEPNNPHQVGGYKSHHNKVNPKLDIRINNNDAKKLAEKLKSTGYFSRVSIESDHLDVQIDLSKYEMA